jgi:transcriptional regulator with XRE-family HTH domain
MDKLGDKIRALSEERCLTQRELAAALGMAPSTLGNYIRNTREADYETVKLFADYFGVSIDYLLGYQPKVTEGQNEDELLRVYRSLSVEQQSLFIELGKTLAVAKQSNR